MTRHEDSHSPKPDEVVAHYASGYEADRLHTGIGQLDRERSRELFKRFLPLAPVTILDVGGGPGGHACWLLPDFAEWWDHEEYRERLHPPKSSRLPQLLLNLPKTI